MNLDINHHRLDIPCPECGQKMNEPIGRLKHDANLTCPKCKTAFRIDAEQLRSGIKTIEKSLDDLRKTLRKLGK